MIYKQLFTEQRFFDKYEKNPKDAVDIIVPLKTVNELFKVNLLSWYREVPVRSVIVGDAGASSDVLRLLCMFPRVRILDCRGMKTLGFCLKTLINEVSSESFLYLHADVFLPTGWLTEFKKESQGVDWAESRARMLVMASYIDQYEDNAPRAFSGAQMGNTRLLQRAVSVVEDDYLYRNEDIVIRELVEQSGGYYKRVNSPRFIHEQLFDENIKKVSVQRDVSKEQTRRMLWMQIHGVWKYCRRKPWYLWVLLGSWFLWLIKLRVKK